MKRKKIFCCLAQTTLEYTVLLGIVVAALVAMSVYVKRSAQGNLRNAVSEISERYNPGTTASLSRTGLTINSTSSSSGGLSHTQVTQRQNKVVNETTGVN